ncbi:MAG: hypothetical protein WCQ64_03840, partial [Acidobacteriota bacterium]
VSGLRLERKSWLSFDQLLEQASGARLPRGGLQTRQRNGITQRHFEKSPFFTHCEIEDTKCIRHATPNQEQFARFVKKRGN